MSRVVVVTGGTRGIGRAVVERFSGDQVIALAREMVTQRSQLDQPRGMPLTVQRHGGSSPAG